MPFRNGNGPNLKAPKDTNYGYVGISGGYRGAPFRTTLGFF